jgi:hypothetical protein
MHAEVRKVVTYHLSSPYSNRATSKRLVCYKAIVEGRAVDSALTHPRAARALNRYIHARLKDYVDANHL